MKVAGGILFRVAALLAMSVACYWLGFTDYPGIGGASLNVIIGASILASSRTSAPRPIQWSHAAIGICFGLVVIALCIWGASSGYNKASNEWFRQSAVRPWVAGAAWLAYASALLFSFRQRKIQGIAHTP